MDSVLAQVYGSSSSKSLDIAVILSFIQDACCAQRDYGLCVNTCYFLRDTRHNSYLPLFSPWIQISYPCCHSTAGKLHVPIAWFNGTYLSCRGLNIVSKKRRFRLCAIADAISNTDYDIVALQELWMPEDFEYLKQQTQSLLPYAKLYYR